MERCVRCIMPDTVPGIEFNEDGLCSLCQSYEEPSYLGEDKLEEVFNVAKMAEGKYDCIVPLSGGRDSSFVLYFAKVRYNMNPLAVNYDNGFRAEQAITNMKNACSKLGADFLEVQSKRDIARKIVKNEIKFVMRRGLFSVSEVLCGACAYGYRSAVYRTAIKYNVPLIIWGSSHVESTPRSMMKSFQELKRREAEKYTRSKIFSLLDISYLRLRYYKLLQRIESHVPGNSIFSESFPVLHDKNIKEISLFDFLPWDREEIKETITRELGWQKPEDRVSSWRTDCVLPPFINYCLMNLFGCSKSCIGYCNMINNGQMTRELALQQEEQADKKFTDDLRDLLENTIGLSKDEVDKIKEL